MVSVVDQVIQLTGKVIGYLLDWPFLLFVLLVWGFIRFRDEIGSFLDRRATIGRRDLSAAFREEASPLAKDLANLKVDVRQLRSDAQRFDAAQSDYRLQKLVAPLQERISAMEKREELLRADLDSASRGGPSPELTARLESLSEEIRELKELGHALETRIVAVMSGDSVMDLRAGLETQSQELRTLKKELEILKSEIDRRSEPSPSERTAGQGGRESAQAVERATRLKVMKEALSSTRWEWRRVKKLASLAGVTEEQALEMLETDSAFTVKKDDWGRRIARLSEH